MRENLTRTDFEGNAALDCPFHQARQIQEVLPDSEQALDTNVFETPVPRCPFHRSKSDLGMDGKPEVLIVSQEEELQLEKHWYDYVLPRALAQFVTNWIERTKEFFSGSRTDERSFPYLPYDANLLKAVINLPRNPLEFLQNTVEKYGPDILMITPTGHTVFICTDPEVQRHILMRTDGKEARYRKGRAMIRGAESVFGKDNIIIGSGEAWQSRRQAMAGYFGRTRFQEDQVLENMQRVVDTCVDELEQQIQESPGGMLALDLSEEFSIVTLRVFLSTFFGMDDVSRERLTELNKSMRIVMDLIPEEAVNLVPGSIGDIGKLVPTLHYVTEAQSAFDAFADEIIAVGKSRENPQGDLLDMLVHARDAKSGALLNAQTLREEILTLIVTGHETTAQILGFCMGAVIQDSKIYQKLEQEIDEYRGEVFSDAKEMESNLTYLGLNKQEALRMYAPFYWVPRKAMDDDVISTRSGKVYIPKGCEIVLSPFLAQRREDLFGVEATGYPANVYTPERWSFDNLSETKAKNHNLKLSSFGGGRRTCLGVHFFDPEFMMIVRSYFERLSFRPLYRSVEEGIRGEFSIQREGGIP
ncbi:MAG: cytochrome P450, partial [Bdellovibrionales bacterium]|nr:cytochrome P450 [Bdellovibrionales bacterium]